MLLDERQLLDELGLDPGCAASLPLDKTVEAIVELDNAQPTICLLYTLTLPTKRIV